MANPSTWTEGRVCEWLQDSKLGHLAPVFKKNSIDGATLMSLEKADLREELKIDALKDRKELWGAIEGLHKSGGRGGYASPTTAKPAATPVAPIQLKKSVTDEPPKLSPRYQSEYNASFGKGEGVAMTPPRSPRSPVATKLTTVSDSDPLNCEHCFKPFGKGTDRIVLTLPGESKGAHLHESCKHDWTKENAKPCEHCGELMTTGIVTVTLPGANRGADLHVACKDSWLQRNAKRCDHCHDPMTTDLVTISGGFGEACVHEKCCDAFEAELKKRPRKTVQAVAKPTVLTANPPSGGLSPRSPSGRSSPCISPRAGVKCAECGVKMPGEPMVNLTGPWGIANVHKRCSETFQKKRKHAQYNAPGSGSSGRCDHCLKRFMPKDSPVMVTIPGSNKIVEMHTVCHQKWSKINAPKCENCLKPMVTEIITLSGTFGKAECHRECVSEYERKLKSNGGRKP